MRKVKGMIFKNFNYTNDSLLLDNAVCKSVNYITAKDIINSSNTILTFDGQTLNLISALIKKSDFNKKLPLHHTPYAYINLDHIINHLPGFYTKNKHLNLRRILSNYMCYKTTIQWKHYDNWFKHQCFPLLFLRILSKIYSKHFKLNENKVLRDIILNTEGITDSRRQNFFNPPRKLNDLIVKPIFYLAGISLGDGSNVHSEDMWHVTDGHLNKEHLIFSYKHLIFIKILIKKHFNLKSKIVKMHGNKFSLRITNKFFARYLNFFLDIPFGKKKTLRMLSLITLVSKKQGLELKKAFYRGFFDSDGSIVKNSTNVQIGTISATFMYDLYMFLKEIGLNPCIRTYQKDRLNPLINVFITSKDYLKFASNIGFLHPLKKKLLIKRLKKGPKEKECKGLKDVYSIGDYIPLNKLDKLHIKNAEKLFKRYRQNIGLSQRSLGKRINITRSTISSWEREINNIPFKTLLTLACLNEKSRDYLIKDLEKINSRYLYCSYASNNLIKIPLKITKKLTLLARVVIPLKNKLYIRRKNNKLKKDMNLFFDIKIKTDKKEDYISSLLLKDVFQELFTYGIPWKPLTEEQVKRIETNWELFKNG